MSFNRRDFLKLTGLGAVSAVAARAAAAFPFFGGAPGAVKAETNAKTAKRWAMVVDLTKCKENCTDCIDACHTTHNVPDFGDDKRHEVKWIWKEPYKQSFPDQENEFLKDDLSERRVLVFCNHCQNPPCTRVCPTRATWKRPEDGIVMMDWHRCIGCRYCMAACPYGSRSFNWLDPRPHIKTITPDYPTRTRGVVEKCNFCDSRLAQGQMPACVEACKDRALIFGDLEAPDSPVRQILRERFSIRRKPELGTQPQVYYVV
ncbi:MAG: 4Fe-4S dicluster domain-containing protein [Candidatus Sumerlaeota bacterium]|nr:4Fe-4S dicluster domain-containing protein [Candidatus Sumerlaeota bacterium]